MKEKPRNANPMGEAIRRLGVSREERAKEGKLLTYAIIPIAREGGSITESNDITEVAKDTLETLLANMGVVASVVPQAGPVIEEEAATPLVLDVEGDDLGILIGRRGQTLASLQFVLRLIVGHRTKAWLPIIVDVAGYRQRRCEKLCALAVRLAEQVKVGRVPFTLEPMLAYERRIIHVALADHPDVITESIGEGEARKVVIQLKQ